jgi:hypothetical protein
VQQWVLRKLQVLPKVLPLLLPPLPKLPHPLLQRLLLPLLKQI